VSEYIIKIDSICKSFSNKPVLQDFSLNVESGEFVSVIGRNGAGKTTLFSCIAGLTNFNSGSIAISVDGETQTLQPGTNKLKFPIRMKMGIVFQEETLWPHKTVLQNVMVPLMDTRNKDKNEANNIANEWLDKLKVSKEDFSKYPQELSGGLRRRVAIARTLSTDPDILLLDEVTAHLDPEAVENILGILENQFIKDPNKTVLMVTHRVDFLTRCATKVVILDKGVKIQEGRPYEIFESPQGETIPILQGVIDPAKAEWVLGYQCLASSINISSAMLKQDDIQSSIFHAIAKEVYNLLNKLEPGQPHLVLIITKELSKERKSLLMRAMVKSERFILDGDDVSPIQAVLPGKKKNTTSDKSNIEVEKWIDKIFVEHPQGIEFYSDNELSKSLIAMLFNQRHKPNYHYAKRYPPIEGVYHTQIPIPDSDFMARQAYCEFSKGTNNVYIFPMEWDNNIVGVISIDTYSVQKWPPFVVRYIKLIANLGAIAIKIMETSEKIEGA
jgi:ABC-type polar amino acid transport system ATPase subunit